MSNNRLLLWMSAGSQGSWQQFRAAVERLNVLMDGEDPEINSAENHTKATDLPLYQTLRLNLERLAHGEFFSSGCADGWRVVPPTLATVKLSDHYLGVLSGARSSRLLHGFMEAAAGLSYEIETQVAAPDRICVRAGDLSALASTAENAGLFFQKDAPTVILSKLPVVDDPRTRRRAEMPPGTGWTIRRFSVSNLRWVSSNVNEVQNAQRALSSFRMGHQHFYYLCIRGITFKVNVQVGKYTIMRRRRRNVLQYDWSSRCLSMPAICQPPPLTERALILCTGSLPQYDRSTGHLTYNEIPKDVASLAAQLLHQEV